MGQFFWLVNTPNQAPDFAHQLTHHGFVVAQQYLLEDHDLSRFDGIVLTMHSDIEFAEEASRGVNIHGDPDPFWMHWASSAGDVGALFRSLYYVCFWRTRRCHAYLRSKT